MSTMIWALLVSNTTPAVSNLKVTVQNQNGDRIFTHHIRYVDTPVKMVGASLWDCKATANGAGYVVCTVKGTQIEVYGARFHLSGDSSHEGQFVSIEPEDKPSFWD